MGRYIARPIEIEAEKFRWGMESGVQRYGRYIPRDGDQYPVNMRSTINPGYLSEYDREIENMGYNPGQWIPYLQTADSPMEMVREGGYLVYDDGQVHLYRGEDFEAKYTPAEEN